MKLAIASDHAGFPLKEPLIDHLVALGHEVIDLGVPTGDVPADYPDIATEMAGVIQSGQAARGILVCGSGVGISIAANKFPGVYAAVCHDTYSAHQGVEHDRMNVLTIGARVVGIAVAVELVAAFVAAQPSTEERHARRFAKLLAIEEKQHE